MKPDLQRAALPAAGAVATVAALVLAANAHFRPPALLLAPMMGLEPCYTPAADNTVDARMMSELAQACGGPDGSAARLVEDTVGPLETQGGWRRQSYELGYTLNVPLLKLYKRDGDRWVIDQQHVDRIARTVRDNARPVVIYLFSTHFSQGAGIEQALAQDPANLGWTRDGPLAQGVYYGAPVYNWSFARTDNGITQRRLEAARAMLDALCRLDGDAQGKVRGITLLGELHHLFPDFEAGMGFERDYRVTDYSETSRNGFRAFLRQRFGTIQKMNAALGSGWASFEAVEPPAKDIRKESLADYTEHIDSFAHGRIPISGWAFDPKATTSSPGHVRIYRNGDLVARVPIDKHRQDVLAAVPALGTAHVGWRHDLDYRQLPPGLHRIDVFLEERGTGLVQLASREIAIMDRQQSTPQPVARRAPPQALRQAGPETKAWVDVPRDLASYYYNPMVPLWHEFRGSQVVSYLQHFGRSLPACLAATPRYTHQIIPFTNPGWDETKFAIDASLQKLPGMGLGVSLYGEPTYGPSFSQWLAGGRHERYVITEFHPLKPLSPAEMRQVFDRHARQGAQFLSFFMEPRWQGRKASRHTNLFSFDPENREYGSDVLYRSVQSVLANRKESAAAPAAPVQPATAAPARSAP